MTMTMSIDSPQQQRLKLDLQIRDSERLQELRGEALTHERFDSLHGGRKRTRPKFYERVKQHVSVLRCTSVCVTKCILSLFPVFNTLRSYRLPSDLVHDVVGGLTVCVMHIPQGMAYGMLAGLPPVYGLYSSLFPVAVYFFFGTSKHVSIGTNAIASLMVSSAISRFLSSGLPSFIVVQQPMSATEPSTLSPIHSLEGLHAAQSGNLSNVAGGKSHLEERTIAEDSVVFIDGQKTSMVELRVEVAIAVTLLVGLLQIVMSVLRLGFLTVYLSDSLVSGFTTASAIHVVTSQLSDIVGYKTRQYSGAFNVIYKLVDLARNFRKLQAPNFALAVVCMSILLLVKQKVQPLVNKRLHFPIPIDLLLIVLTTVCSYSVGFKSHGIGITGSVPAGLPWPRLPDVRLLPSIAGDCALMAVICYASTIAMAKTLACKHSYEVHGNQELLAIGMSNAVSACCQSLCTSASLSRSLVQESSGCRSQLASLVSCAGILLVLLFIAPLFETVPRVRP